jgi:hypothetical protein
MESAIPFKPMELLAKQILELIAFGDHALGIFRICQGRLARFRPMGTVSTSNKM